MIQVTNKRSKYCQALLVAWLCVLSVLAPNLSLAELITVNEAGWNSNPGDCKINCSLLDAVTLANSTPEFDTINFAIPGSGIITIVQDGMTPLPDITAPVMIDGTSQATGLTTPLIELQGAGSANDSIIIAAPGCTIKGLIINRFRDAGITVKKVSDTTIIGNWIGLDKTGIAALGNSLHGIKVDTAPRTLIGGSSASLRNVISGNLGSGISIIDSPDTTVDGNWIGLNASGLAAVGNSLHGISVESSINLTIGGSGIGQHNIISGNGGAGIKLSNGGTAVVSGNSIGLDATGTIAIGNNSHGIELIDYSNSVIGGNTFGTRNVISGNQQAGISVVNSDAISIDGNWIGLNATGIRAVGNGASGITIYNSPRTEIGGTTAGTHNIISGNGASGIKLTNGNGATITGNWIGLDSTGLKAAGNSLHGIEMSSYADVTVGGSNSGARNVISGNGSYGIAISGVSSTGIQIKGNYIGTDSLGSSAVANSGGISLSSPGNTIGGTAEGEGNVIAGVGTNALYQLLIANTEGNKVYGNYIGTNATGTAALSIDSQGIPRGVGIAIYDSRDNTIGTPGAGNLLSGNSFGIELKATSTTNFPVTGNTIQANLIGTNAEQSAAIPNTHGIVMTANIQGALSGNMIGGANSAGSIKGNIISGNGLGAATGRGIQIVGPFAEDNAVQGNFIGTSRDGTIDLGNTGPGILLDCANTDVSDNTIQYNGDAGIVMLRGSGNQISHNKISANAGLGIDQFDEQAQSGPNPPDIDDTDSGPNNFQNFPEFEIATSGRNQIQVKGTLNSTPATQFSLEFYLNNVIDPSGYGEGETFLGTKVVTTNGKGQAQFSENFNGTLSAGGGITAIATDSKGNSSEFSLAVRPAKEVKPGGKVNDSPVVAVVEDVVTVSLPVYQPPKKRKPKRGITARAAKAPKRTVNYQVTVKTDARTVIKRITSKRNVVTIRNLPPGNYAANYRVSVKEGKSVVATTRPSPSTTFTVRQNTTTSSLNALFKSRWCPEILMPACDEFWP